MNIEIVTVNDEIKVIGLSHCLLGMPGTIESLHTMWEMYGEKYRNKIKNAITPLVDYGINANTLGAKHEYIAGCAVTQISRLDINCVSYIVPPGKYIKHTCRNMEDLFKYEDDVKTWAETNKIDIDRNYMVEAYPVGAFDKRDVEVYTLHPIQCSK